MTVTAPLYEPQTITVEATNLFHQEGEFAIRLFETADKSLIYPAPSKTMYIKYFPLQTIGNS